MQYLGRSTIALLAIGALVVALVPRSRSAPATDITAEPAPVATMSVVEPVVTDPELASPALRTSPASPRHTKKTPPTELDWADPWTAEDLRPEIQALASPPVHLDRVDPWTPTTYYPVQDPSTRDLDESNPWVRGNDHIQDNRAAKAVASKTKTTVQLAPDDPWATSAPEPTPDATSF